MEIVKEGHRFGEHAFFIGNEYINTSRSRNFTTVYKIDRESFLKIIQSNPK